VASVGECSHFNGNKGSSLLEKERSEEYKSQEISWDL